MSEKCAALEWMQTEQGKDYITCSKSSKLPPRLCRLSGLLISVEVVLCNAHENYFRKHPKGWGLVELEVVNPKENQKGESECQ